MMTTATTTTRTFTIKQIDEKDWPDVASIFQEGINEGHSTFETNPASSFAIWVDGKYESCCLIARESEDGKALGWVSLSSTSKRFVFRGVAELSIYVASDARRKGVATALLNAVFSLSEAANIWSIQSGIFPENIISIQMHEKFGFRTVGRREKIGKMLLGPMAGQWRDIVLMERRSIVVGVD